MIERLENNQQVLLLYLADELSAEDRREVEQMLAVDAGLRAQLQQLEDCQRVVYEGLSRLDGPSPLTAGEAAAARRVTAEIRRRLAKPEAVEYQEPAERRRRSFWWVYPTAAAALVVLAAAIWMPRHNPPRTLFPNGGPSREYSYPYWLAQLYDESWDPTGSADEPDLRPASEDVVAMSDNGHRDRLPPIDPLNQLLLSADANQ